MSYVDFEDEGVIYRLILSRHGSKRKEPINGLDALVVESGVMNPKEFADDLTERPELANYLEEIAERDIPLYSVDDRGRNFLLPMMATGVGHMLIPPVMAYGISKLTGADHDTAYTVALGTLLGGMSIQLIPSFLGNGISKYFTKISSFLSLLRQSPIEELTNALAARKIKKGVVPHLIEHYQERFKDRNPNIGIIYGAAHSGIKECLESDLRSGLSLGLHKHYGLRFILDRNTLRNFYEYKSDGDGHFSYQKLQIESV